MVLAALFLGHAVGDYLFQGDWMALNKRQRTWPCVVHCLVYTLCVCLVTLPVLSWPLWAWAVVAVAHFPFDRWGWARHFMRPHAEKFATGPMAPWSIVVVDNIFHLLVLYALCLWIGAS
jgi:hypothetical protein